MKLIINFLLIAIVIFSQELVYLKSIGNFHNANNFCVIDRDNIYVIDRTGNRLLHLNSNGDVLNETGGFGWCNTCFDFPGDIFTNQLNVFVVDKNNNTITIFDRKLNFINKIKIDNQNSLLQKVKFAQLSSDGFFFFYDEIKKRIFKLNMNLNYLIDFGGVNYKDYYIKDIKKLLVNTYVCAVTDTIIFIFDKFGTPFTKLEFSQKIKSFFIKNNLYYILFDDCIRIGNLTTNEYNDLEINKNINFVDFCVLENNILGLIKSEIIVYNFINK